MTRRTPPSPISLLPSHIATPPRDAPKYHLPALPRLIPLIDSVGPKLRIHAFTTPASPPSHHRVEPARMGQVAVLIRAPEREGRQGAMRVDRRARVLQEDGVENRRETKVQPPWLVSRGFDEAGEARAGDIGLAPLQEARIRVRA